MAGIGWADSSLLAERPAHRHKRVLEHVIRHAPALGDTCDLVERPMDTEVDAALAVLFLGLGERREAARDKWAHVPLVIPRHAVELVRHEGEGDVVGPVKVAQGLEEGAPEPGMSGRVAWEGRREVRLVEVAGLRAERREGWISDSRGIAIAGTGRAGPLVGLAYAGDRAPELVEVLRLPDGDAGIAHRHVHKRQEPRELDGIPAHLVGDFYRDLVVQPRRRAQIRRSVVGPVDPRYRLVFGSLRRGDDTVAAQALHLIKSGRILRTVHGRGRRSPELVSRLQDKRIDLAPVCAHNEREPADRVLA